MNAPNAQTPWGFSDYAQLLAPGITFYSTPSHGGLHVAPEQNRQVLEKFPGFRTYCGQPGWYEEDCDWAAVALTFPDIWPQHQAAAQAQRPYILTRCQGATIPARAWPRLRAAVDRLRQTQAEEAALLRTAGIEETSDASEGGGL